MPRQCPTTQLFSESPAHLAATKPPLLRDWLSTAKLYSASLLLSSISMISTCLAFLARNMTTLPASTGLWLSSAWTAFATTLTTSFFPMIRPLATTMLALKLYTLLQLSSLKVFTPWPLNYVLTTLRPFLFGLPTSKDVNSELLPILMALTLLLALTISQMWSTRPTLSTSGQTAFSPNTKSQTSTSPLFIRTPTTSAPGKSELTTATQHPCPLRCAMLHHPSCPLSDLPVGHLTQSPYQYSTARNKSPKKRSTRFSSCSHYTKAPFLSRFVPYPQDCKICKKDFDNFTFC